MINKTINGVSRELLDAPAEKFNPKGWAIDHSAGRPILVHNNCSVIEAEQAYGLLELIKSAAQPQGEPVVWQYRIIEGGEPLFHSLNKDGWINTIEAVANDMAERPCLGKTRHYEVRKLYAEQPPPVAAEQNKINHLKQLLRNVRATLHFTPEDVIAIDAALREDEE